jgi:hypothetical protein
MDRRERDVQHIALPTAAALVYFEVTGKQLVGSMDLQVRAILCDVAHALSMLAPVYMSDDSSAMPTEVPAADLIGAAFERGAHQLVFADGTTHRNLSIQRKDLEAAIVVLRQCGFERRWRSGTNSDVQSAGPERGKT